MASLTPPPPPPLRTSKSALSLSVGTGYIRTPVHSPAPLRRTRSASPCHWDPTSDDDEPQSPLAKVGHGISELNLCVFRIWLRIRRFPAWLFSPPSPSPRRRKRWSPPTP
ncbi:hypothetical protein Q8F55_002820 [Vanrija albida]|uniref:Uncharacterized protein n=1 Tax=Vanrija albida TaxID=181172 RepID=A0ABR3QAU0_9TREE